MSSATATQTASTPAADLSDRDRLLLWLPELGFRRVEPQATGSTGLELPLAPDQCGHGLLHGGSCVFVHLAAEDAQDLHRWVLFHFNGRGALLGNDLFLQGLSQPLLTDDHDPDPLPCSPEQLERKLGVCAVAFLAAESAVRQLQLGVAA